MPERPWPARLRLHEVQRGPLTLHLEPDVAERTEIARRLDLLELKALAAEVEVRPWLAGAEVAARWTAEIVQACGVSLDPFDTSLSGSFTVRAVPPDSAAAVPAEAELSLDPEAEDPPDVLERDTLDLGAYLVEHLALEIDPFPRKPGVAYEPPPEEKPTSPFAVLKALKDDPPPG